MKNSAAMAIAHPNIAFIKYWGNIDNALRIPANGSISMNLGALETQTTVQFRDQAKHDQIRVNGVLLEGQAFQRVHHILSLIRQMSGEMRFAEVESVSNFPIGAGIASSAAAFSALALAGSAAAGLALSESDCSRLARCGSGSACRSIPGGFVEWLAGDSDETSIAVSIAPADYWDVVDLIAVVSDQHKKVGSSEGHQTASSSPYQESRIVTASDRVVACRNAILRRNFDELAEVSERDSVMMHAVMMTQQPPLFYWAPASLEIMQSTVRWRQDGLDCFSTLDAGPNVHVICPAEISDIIATRLENIAGVIKVIRSGVGGPARLVD